jgi:hypothetical protein
VTATVISPFPYASAVGDTYCYAGVNIGLQDATTMTTDLKRVLANAAGSGGAGSSIWDLGLNGTTNSYVDLMMADNAWNQVT